MTVVRSQPLTALVACPGADMYGSDRMAARTVGVLREAGWDVVFTAPSSGPLMRVVEGLGARVIPCPTPIIRRNSLDLRRPFKTAIGQLNGLRDSWRLLSSVRPDVVYVNTITAPTWLMMARVRRIGAICHVREAESQHSRTALKALYVPLFAADIILLNSETSRSVLRSAFRRLAARGKVVYNELPQPSHVADAREAPLSPCRLLFVGRLIPRKGLHVAIDAVAKLHDEGIEVALDVVGSTAEGYEAYAAEVRGQIASHGLTDSVVFHGFQSDVWPHLTLCDIALIPSILPESFGNTAVEAMLAGRPRVVSDFPGLREATRDSSATVYATPGDVDELANAIATILVDWTDFRSAAIDDANMARKVHSAEHYASALVSTFDDVADA